MDNVLVIRIKHNRILFCHFPMHGFSRRPLFPTPTNSSSPPTSPTASPPTQHSLSHMFLNPYLVFNFAAGSVTLPETVLKKPNLISSFTKKIKLNINR